MNKKDFWIGIGVGATVGIAGGFVIGNQVTKKHARRDMKRIRHSAYLRGVEDAKKEAEQVIDELTENVVFVDQGATAEDIQKAIDEKMGSAGTLETKEDDPEPEDKYTDDSVYGISDAKPQGLSVEGNYAVITGVAGTKIFYPKKLFFDPLGELLSALDIRKNLKEYEADVAKLRFIWNLMGWGTYIPDPDDIGAQGDDDDGEDFLNADLSYLGDEPMEKTIERERWMDEIDRYKAHPEEAPRIVSKDEFDDEAYLEKTYVDYYDVDNVFSENTDMDRTLDPYTYFGVSDGKELFSHASEDDPDIVHVKNFKMNCIMEVTRFHKAYAGLKDGSAYVNGGST